MKISEIRDKDTQTLKEELRTLAAHRLDVAMRAVTEDGVGQQISAIRKDMARYKTILNERRGVEA